MSKPRRGQKAEKVTQCGTGHREPYAPRYYLEVEVDRDTWAFFKDYHMYAMDYKVDVNSSSQRMFQFGMTDSHFITRDFATILHLEARMVAKQ